MSDIILPQGLTHELQKDIAVMGKGPHGIDNLVQTFFKIKDKNGALIDFTYNRPQQLLSERSSQFDKVLKARKMGISSRRIARDLWVCATQKNQHRIALTHSGDAKDIIMVERVNPFIKNCKFPLGAVLRSDYIYFPLTDSRYYLGTAGSKKFGRGDDITGRHYLETAHWEDPEVIAGVDEALTDNADGLDETTANGHNFWKKDWEAAKKGLNRDRAIFLPWYADEGYVKSLLDEPGPLTEEEKSLMVDCNLSDQQIAWRRWKIRTMRDPALFPQEYPETDEQAFLSSGRPVFNWITLSKLKSKISPPKWRGYLMREIDRIVFVEDKLGPLSVWRQPERGHVYGIGSDVAEGIKGGAYTTGEVLDIGDSEQVAEWHGHIAPDIWADTLHLLSQWYNGGVIVPEAWPGPGEVTTSHLLDLRANVWLGVDNNGNENSRYGFETNRSTKPLMITRLSSALNDLELTIRSARLLDELHSFMYDEKMLMGPSLGNFSDCVMGMGIIWYCSRDFADRVDYYKPQRPPFIRQAASTGGTTIPRWEGPKFGRRPE